jgi:DNA-binding cell septation regulator SpoVG
MPAEIKVVAVRPLNKDGSLKAFVSVQLGAITIHDFRVIQQEGKKAWVAMPQKEVPQPDGTKKYHPIIELSDALKEKVTGLIMEEWKKVAAPPPAAVPSDPIDDDIPF